MKKIIDYVNQNVAIHCSTKEEWDKIINLFPSNVSVGKSCWGSFVHGGNSDTISITGCGWSPKKYYEGGNYTIYPASDFLEKKLTSFPSEGCCETTNMSLVTFLTKRPNCKEGNNVSPYNAKGIGWNSTSHWWLLNVQNSSKTLYTLNQLEPFLLKETLQFEKGKWYCRQDGITKSGALKFDSFEGTSLKYSERISSIFDYKEGINVVHWELKDIRETSLEEIQQYLPYGHPDKIIENIPEYVELIKDSIWGVNKGAICKVIRESEYNVSKTQHILENIYIPNSQKFSENKNWFFILKTSCKPSTKEAYEAQNKLTYENLLSNEIYVGTWENNRCIFIKNLCCIDSVNRFIKSKDICNGNNITFKVATSEEKKWLNTCIKQDIFVKLEDLHLYNDEGNLIQKNMFKKGDYIVTLKININSNCAKENYCFKQRIDNKGIYPEVDLSGGRANGYNGMSFDKKTCLKDWRYATSEEIVEYERLGKPFDVTTLKKSLIGRYLKALVDSPNGGLVKKGEYGLITDENLLHVDFESQKNYSCSCALDYPELYELMPIGFIPPDKEEWIPEPGEWVVMIRPYPELEKGKAYQIVKQQLKNNKKYWVLDHNGETNSFSAPGKDTSFRKALPHEIPSLSLDYTEYDGKDRYNFNKKSFNEDINIILINKQKRQLPVITIESPTYLDLKLKTTKPKQIQKIKI